MQLKRLSKRPTKKSTKRPESIPKGWVLFEYPGGTKFWRPPAEKTFREDLSGRKMFTKGAKTIEEAGAIFEKLKRKYRYDWPMGKTILCMADKYLFEFELPKKPETREEWENARAFITAINTKARKGTKRGVDLGTSPVKNIMKIPNMLR